MDDFNTFLSGSSCVEARQHPDPRRQQGVPVFREEVRSFSVGDRIQFTAPANDLKVANRELGTIERIRQDGRLSLKMDGGRRVELGSHKRLHLDYGYAMTSHSSQGQTADRVLIHVDTELSAKDLLSSRMAYVAISRGAYDAQTYTNNASTLGRELSRDISHSPAIQQESVAQKIEPKPRMRMRSRLRLLMVSVLACGAFDQHSRIARA